MTSTTVDRRDGVNSSVAVKAPCRVATTVNITLSGEQTIDVIAVVSGDRVLVKNQTNTVENGIYQVSTSAWTREPDFDTSRDVVTGTHVIINNPGSNTRFYRVATTGVIRPGTTGITFLSAGDIAVFTSSDTVVAANIAALTALTGMLGNQQVSVLGYNDPGDGGDDTFYWDSTSTATANRGTVFESDAGGTGRWIRVYSGAINTKWFGAIEGQSAATITAAIQAAINSLSDGEGLELGDGLLPVSSTISIEEHERLHLFGTGTLEPTTALAGLPVVEFVNCRDSLLENWTVLGNVSGAPAAGVRFRRVVGTIAPTSMRVKNVRIGSTASNSVVDGIDFIGDDDSNNAESILENVKIRNFSGVGINIEHSNSLNHQIINPNISGGPTAIKTNGGSFYLSGGAFNVTDLDFDIGGVQRAASEVVGLYSESNAKMIRIASTTNPPRMSVTHYTKKGSTAGTTVIDVSGADAVLTMAACNMDLGQSGQTFSFSDAGSQIKFTGCHLGATTFSWAGLLTLVGNTYSAGTVTYTPDSTAELRQFGEQGGDTGDIGFRLGQAGRTGAIVREYLSTTFAPNFGSTADGAVSDLTVSVPGAADIDVVTLGIQASGIPAGAAGYYAWVSAADTVTVRFWNASGAAIDPPLITIRVGVWKH